MTRLSACRKDYLKLLSKTSKQHKIIVYSDRSLVTGRYRRLFAHVRLGAGERVKLCLVIPWVGVRLR